MTTTVVMAAGVVVVTGVVVVLSPPAGSCGLARLATTRAMVMCPGEEIEPRDDTLTGGCHKPTY